jgi:hypothetical protein
LRKPVVGQGVRDGAWGPSVVGHDFIDKIGSFDRGFSGIGHLDRFGLVSQEITMHMYDLRTTPTWDVTCAKGNRFATTRSFATLRRAP